MKARCPSSVRMSQPTNARQSTAPHSRWNASMYWESTCRAVRLASLWSGSRRPASCPTARAAPVTAPQVPPHQATPPFRAMAREGSGGSARPKASARTMYVVSAHP